MKANTILRPNAVPVYTFLSLITAKKIHEGLERPIKILDCGAGGAVPPLALFQEHSFDTWGIDISEEQLDLARSYCAQNQIQINLRKGDMRQIPFEDEAFDCVYEHYSMCHLSKQDTADAVNEMYRVVRKDGLCFLGVISIDSWPRSSFGLEKQPGEFWMEEGDRQVRHSMFSDQEADRLVSDWEIISKEKRVTYLRTLAEKTTEDEWMDLHPEEAAGYTPDAWRDQYSQRANLYNYSHLYYILRKP